MTAAAGGESAVRRVGDFRAFAVVPAAGRSTRMGSPKLLLPWGHDSTLIEQVIAAWRRSPVERVVVTVHPEDSALAEVCRRAGAEVVVPEVPPEDMKTSIRRALEHLARTASPGDDDVWLAAPADVPGLSSSVITRLIASHDPQRPAILRPLQAGRHGHPALFPWPVAVQVAQLTAAEGLDVLMRRLGTRDLECGANAAPDDVDTPDDYRRLRDRYDRT